MTTTTKTRKKSISQVPGNGSPPPKNQEEKVQGSINYFQKIQEGDSVHKQWVQEQLAAKRLIPISWLLSAEIMYMMDFCLNNPEYQSLYGREHASEAQLQFGELHQYDPDAWQKYHKFVPRKDALDCNGKPPALGFVRLPIDPFRQVETLPLEVASSGEELYK